MGLVVIGCGVPSEARFITQIDWMEKGQWIKADTHIHTRFSDGAHGIDEIAVKAKEFGCDAIAITDHGDRNLSAATPEYAEAILAARRSHPGLLILAGLEWNVPPWGGDEHATLLVPPGPNEFLTLAEFKRQFDDLGRETHNAELALAAFDWLGEIAKAQEVSPLIFSNHPCRAVDRSDEVAVMLADWRTHTNLVAGFSGAPGHQKSEGAYKGKVSLIDRWDPAAAEVGGAWDQLLAKGEDLWAARAPSDFHSPKDYWPGEFSETWLYVPERTLAGVLRAYKAGSFFADHGHIARNVELRVRAEGLSRPAYAGETIAVSTDSSLTVELNLDVPRADWEGRPNRIDQIELIAVTGNGARIIAEEPLYMGKPFTRELKGLSAGFVLRARGRRIVPDGPDLLFYTNPIRIVTENQSLFSQAWKLISQHLSWRRLWGGGVLLLIAASLIVWFRQRQENKEDYQDKPKRKSKPKQSSSHAEWVSAPTGTPPGRLHFLVAALGFLFLATYGSWVPLNFRPMTFEKAWDYFWFQQNWGQVNFGNRSDWGANVLLFIPIAFFGTGLWCLDRKSPSWKVLGTLLVLAVCTAASLVIEFFQAFIHARVPSHDDVYAQSVGTLIGMISWFAFGQILTNWWRLHTSKRDRQPLLASVLSVYVLGLIAYSLIPLDFIIHPAELYKKYQEGRIVLVPDWHAGITKGSIWQSFSQLLIFVPVGVWASVIWRDENRRRTWVRGLLIGGAVAVLIEAAQVFLLSRFAETSDALTAVLGVAIGAGGVWYFQSRQNVAPATEDQKLLRNLAFYGAAVLYAGFLVCYFCWPLEIDRDPARIHRNWNHFFRAPMTALYWSPEYVAATQILQKLFLWSILGVLVGQPVLTSQLPKTLKRLFLFALLLLCWLVGTGVELLQLLMPAHTPDSTDIGLYTVGAGLGMWGAVWWHRQSQGLPHADGSVGSGSAVSSPG